MNKNKENRNVFSHLNKTVVKNLLLIHACGGCDTISSVFNQEKSAILSLIEKGNLKILNACAIFDYPSATQKGIGKARFRVFTVMYGMVCLPSFSIRIFNAIETNFFSTRGKKTRSFMRSFISLEWAKVNCKNTRFFLNKIKHLLLKCFPVKSNFSIRIYQLSLRIFCILIL